MVTETLLPLNYKLVLDWFLEISNAGEEYSNPEIYEFGNDDEDEGEDVNVGEGGEVIVDDAWKPVSEDVE